MKDFCIYFLQKGMSLDEQRTKCKKKNSGIQIQIERRLGTKKKRTT